MQLLFGMNPRAFSLRLFDLSCQRGGPPFANASFLGTTGDLSCLFRDSNTAEGVISAPRRSSSVRPADYRE